MKLAVSYDREGNILTLFDPDSLVTSRGTFAYLPAPGEMHRLLDLPIEAEGISFLELPYALRVNTEGASPVLERRELPTGHSQSEIPSGRESLRGSDKIAE